MATLRTFVALTLEPDLLERLGQWQLQQRKWLEPLAPRLRALGPGQLHMTLAFLGDTPAEIVPQVAGLVEQVARRHQPLVLPAERLLFLPKPQRIQVVALGCSDPGGRAVALAQDLWEELSSVGWRRELREFLPHVTLLRSRHPFHLRPTQKVGVEPSLRDIVLRLGHLVHYASYLESAGARYEPLSASMLGIAAT